MHIYLLKSVKGVHFLFQYEERKTNRKRDIISVRLSFRKYLMYPRKMTIESFNSTNQV